MGAGVVEYQMAYLENGPWVQLNDSRCALHSKKGL